ncbi:MULTISPECIES: YwiC-like family protein [Exiguobacterium]|uniref:YwiC-like family protein n=1 Tax=Exiguobacterium profundum TaxID=307643 RepID=A0ABY8B1H7_9BACL|nr:MULTISPECIES: YwiC-like family protein [Exiguobacterium]MBQ6459981.1 YwiC-like family protein [Exiguobacterium sp.]MBR3214987.1 YwiC-like family protein [Exiguobacterium sp.]MCV9900634.1 YwiC-like family protein [Exiguobacterium sp. N5]MDX5424663.1 YwiC-like family protein [Exiguobacterium sp.]WED55036.1 YwiC-like family protein [Exiguobacterium profundum]
MKWMIPKQHGAWSMLILPFLLGGIVGGWTLAHIPFAIAWLFVYMGTFFLFQFIKQRKKSQQMLRTVITYLTIATVAAIPVFLSEWRLVWFVLAMIPFGLVNAYFAKIKDERNVWNDVSAVTSFCIGGMASYYLGARTLDATMVWVFVLPYLYFLGSIFFVKTMIREKKSVSYRNLSWGYHGLLVAVFIVLGYPLLALAYAPSLIRAVVFYGKKIPIMKIGIVEIANSVFVLGCLSWYLFS